MVLWVKKLDEDAVIPQKAHVSDAGIDLFNLEDVEWEPFEIKKVRTGLAMQIIDDYGKEPKVNSHLFMKLFGRSGIESKTPLLLRAGVIDDYIGEIILVIQNISTESFKIEKHTKIVQAVPLVKPTVDRLEIVDNLLETKRGDSGFGSSDNVK